MRKSIVRITCFVLILSAVLMYANEILQPKAVEGIYNIGTFYEQEDDSVDVLILGSSHAFMNFNTGTLWDGYGMAAYVLGGSSQPMWNTYYYLKEALKTQTPEVIVLEGLGAARVIESFDVEIVINTHGMKWSLDKLNAIKISAPRERWGEFILAYTQYHMRYPGLSEADFYEDRGNPFNSVYRDWKGFYCNMSTMTFEEVMDVSDIDDRKLLYEKTEEYYRKTIELAQENNIPIVVVVTPYAAISETEESLYNTASDIAAEYGVDFINCNLLIDEIGIDYTTDVPDNSHLNYKGNQKFTQYIAQYLKENYSISDRRGDSDYASWQGDAEYISQQIYNQELREMVDFDHISKKIWNENYRLIISVDGDCTTEDESLQTFYSSIGITNDERNGIWYRDNTYGIDWYTHDGDEEKYIQIPAHDFHMRRYTDEEGGGYRNQVIIDNTEYKNVENGINIVVYDTVTDSIVDSFGLDYYDGYRLVRLP